MHQFTVERLTDGFLRRWDGFVRASPEGTIFSSASWLSSLVTAFRFDCRIVCCDTDGAISAAMPLLLRRSWGIRYSPPPPISLYSGWLTGGSWPGLGTAEQRECGGKLLDATAREISFGWFPLPIGAGPHLPASPRWRLHERKTIRVPIEDFERTWAGYSQSLRRKIRRAEETGVTMRETTDVARIVALHETSYFRHGLTPPFAGPALRRWLESLFSAKIVRAYEAVLPDGTAAAVRVVIEDAGIVYDWLAGAAVREAPAISHWLVSGILRRYAQEGARLFDFMGANTPGVSDFKESFGGSAVPYNILSYHRTALLRSLERARGNWNMLKRRRT